jgi:hypothetical protein
LPERGQEGVVVAREVRKGNGGHQRGQGGGGGRQRGQGGGTRRGLYARGRGSREDEWKERDTGDGVSVLVRNGGQHYLP